MNSKSFLVPWRALTLIGLMALGLQPLAGGVAVDYDARLLGKVGDITRPESAWIGAIEIRFRTPFIHEESRDDALAFLRSLALGREVECRLTGERMGPPGQGVLVGDCIIFGPTDGREISLGDRLIERGFARSCAEPQAVIAIWPPVFDCR